MNFELIFAFDEVILPQARREHHNCTSIEILRDYESRARKVTVRRVLVNANIEES
jgi:hypothetical protein